MKLLSPLALPVPQEMNEEISQLLLVLCIMSLRIIRKTNESPSSAASTTRFMRKY